jgi:hypothetical protein
MAREEEGVPALGGHRIVTSRLPFLLSLAALAATSACKKDNDEDLIKAVVRKAVQAANDKKASGVVEDAAEHFKGPRNADLRECRRILIGFFMKKGWIRAFERKLDVTLVDATHAKAILQVALAEGKPVDKPQDLLPTNATMLEFDLDLEKIDGDWKFVKAGYEHLRFEPFEAAP